MAEHHDFTRNDSAIVQDLKQDQELQSFPGINLIELTRATSELPRASANSLPDFAISKAERSSMRVPRPFEIVLTQASADLIVGLLKDGKISDEDSKTISEQIGAAYKGNRLGSLSQFLKARLNETDSGWSVDFDDSSAKDKGELSATFQRAGQSTKLVINTHETK